MTALKIFNGIYSWDGTKADGRDPIAWSSGAYDVKILKRDRGGGNIEMLKPFICVYSATGKGQSISSQPEKFAKQLCDEFSLQIERVFWIEEHKGNTDRYEAIIFTRSMKMGKTIFYKTEKRPLHLQEKQELEKELLLMES